MNVEEPEKLHYMDVDAPDPETVIWRYMDLPKFIPMLKRRALYLPVVATLNDDFEAAPLTLPGPDKWDEHDRWYQWSYVRATTFVSCWYESNDESAAMWKLYGDCVAIRTTIGALSKAISQFAGEGTPSRMEERVFGGRVQYVNPDKESPVEHVWNSVSRVLLKRNWYSHEREFRLVCDRPANFTKGGNLLGMSKVACTPKAVGMWALCDLKVMIDGIVVAPNSPPYLAEAVEAVSEAFDLDRSLVTRSSLERALPSQLISRLKS